jgi:hypothetical protein
MSVTPSADALTIWHYTVQPHFARICADGTLRPSNEYASAQGRSVVWFSTNADWEPMAQKAIALADGSRRALDRDELHTVGIAPIRIGVAREVASHTWHDVKKLAELQAKVAGGIVAAAVRVGSKPSWWLATFDAVPRAQWSAVEQWDGWRWTALPPASW